MPISLGCFQKKVIALDEKNARKCLDLAVLEFRVNQATYDPKDGYVYLLFEFDEALLAASPPRKRKLTHCGYRKPLKVEARRKIPRSLYDISDAPENVEGKLWRMLHTPAWRRQ